jgi:hypothetical protein
MISRVRRGGKLLGTVSILSAILDDALYEERNDSFVSVRLWVLMYSSERGGGGRGANYVRQKVESAHRLRSPPANSSYSTSAIASYARTLRYLL